MLWWKKPSDRENELSDVHFELMRKENHDGSRHCCCQIAVDLRKVQLERETARKEHYAQRKIGRTTREIVLSGALKSTIDAHGPITLELIPSAVKRIMGAIK